MLAYELGEPGPRQDAARSAALFERACHIASPHACMTLAAMRYTGRGAARDLDSARELATRACTLGLPEGCQAIKEMPAAAP
jgi:TPR repeat protein